MNLPQNCFNESIGNFSEILLVIIRISDDFGLAPILVKGAYTFSKEQLGFFVATVNQPNLHPNPQPTSCLRMVSYFLLPFISVIER